MNITDLRMQPKSNYIQTANLEQLYLLTEHWQSDMDFFRDELEFLNKLIGKYLILMTKEESFSNIQQLILHIDQLKKKREGLNESIQRHLRNLQNQIKKSVTDDPSFREEHANLEEEIASFYKEFRTMKKQVFTITEHVMESEKLQHLLKSSTSR